MLDDAKSASALAHSNRSDVLLPVARGALADGGRRADAWWVCQAPQPKDANERDGDAGYDAQDPAAAARGSGGGEHRDGGRVPSGAAGAAAGAAAAPFSAPFSAPATERRGGGAG